MSNSQTEGFVEVNDLYKHFPLSDSLLDRNPDVVKAVDGISFRIQKGETFGLVGESGSGKTTVGKAILRLIEPTSGTVSIGGTDIGALNRKELREFRKRMQLVFQDPSSSLNPRRRIGDIIKKPLSIHNIGSQSERNEKVDELLGLVDLPSEEYRTKYPRALSGGQKQRVAIARALALNPDFIVFDEPTSALDVSVQANIVELLDDLQERFELTYLFITHDLTLIQNIADSIGVMYLGELMESGPKDAVFTNPEHPYTRALLSAIHPVNREDEKFTPAHISLEGEIPDPQNKPPGCAFQSRCPKAFHACDQAEPESITVEPNHVSKCFLHDSSYPDDNPDW